MRSASCLLLPSSREGYGKVVVEAAALGTPSIVVASPDNAATELIEDGVNGYLVPQPDPQAIAAAIERCVIRRQQLRRSTARWYRENAKSLSLERVLESYGAGARAPLAAESRRAARPMLAGKAASQAAAPTMGAAICRQTPPAGRTAKAPSFRRLNVALG